MSKISVIGRNFGGGLILFLAVLAILCFPGLSGEIQSHFHSEVEDGGETTFYTYLKQSDLKESGYTRGLETGSLNYFKGKVTIDDEQTYYDGKIDAKHRANLTDAFPDYLHNSTVDHTLTIDYEGEKGLSLFYAKGFYKSNRAITASKKIWFGNRTYYPTKSIKLTGIARMDMKGTYLMDYTIDKATEAYFVFNDASGFSNKTGSRRIDFEQEGLIKGDISNTINRLELSDDFIAREGIIEDWLPCFCFTGLMPPIEPTQGIDNAWPSQVIKDALKNPAQPENETKRQCEDCGDEYCDDISARAGITNQGGDILKFPDLWVEPLYEPGSTDTYDFTINVRNSGDKDVQDVRLVAERMSADITKVTYVDSSGSVDGSRMEPIPVSKSYIWSLGSMRSSLSGSEAMRTVSLKIRSTDPISDSIQFYAIYKIGSDEVSTIPVKPIGEIPWEV